MLIKSLVKSSATKIIFVLLHVMLTRLCWWLLMRCKLILRGHIRTYKLRGQRKSLRIIIINSGILVHLLHMGVGTY